MLAELLDGELNFGDEDDVGAAGNAGFEGDPTGVAAHDLDDHDAVMGFGSGVNFVDRVGGGVERGVKSEGDLGGGEIVVDGFRNADDLHAFEEEFVGDFHGAIATDGDDGVNAEFGGIGEDLVGDVAGDLHAVLDGFVLKGIAAVGGAEDGAAAREDSADVFESEFSGTIGPDETVEAVGDADDSPLVFEDGGFDGGADDGVEAGGVTAAGADSYAVNGGHGNRS